MRSTAGTQPKIENTPQSSRWETEDMALLAVAVAQEKKAFQPTVLDLKHQGAFTECFVILSGSSGRQVVAIAEEIRTFFRSALGIVPLAIDGFEMQTWVLMDYGSFFVHVFQESTRDMYRLEQLWSKARVVPLNEEKLAQLYVRARQELSDSLP